MIASNPRCATSISSHKHTRFAARKDRVICTTQERTQHDLAKMMANCFLNPDYFSLWRLMKARRASEKTRQQLKLRQLRKVMKMHLLQRLPWSFCGDCEVTGRSCGSRGERGSEREGGEEHHVCRQQRTIHNMKIDFENAA